VTSEINFSAAVAVSLRLVMGLRESDTVNKYTISF